VIEREELPEGVNRYWRDRDTRAPRNICEILRIEGAYAVMKRLGGTRHVRLDTLNKRFKAVPDAEVQR
jgi:hypothetical protein